MEKKIEKLLAEMTLDEKIHLCHGYSSMCVGNIERLGIGSVEMADGPQGFRFEDGRTATALPCGMALACAFDPKAAFEYGEVIGREALASGLQVSLGPGFNLMRTPLNGRNFEYYGEDPVLAGAVATGYIRGCQSLSVAAAPKHLALNNQEICRTTGSSNIDERTLRELYLRAFEIVTKEAEPWMMMSSYNKINGEYASQCRHVQQEIVKDEFGFDGVMVSDWGASHDSMLAALGGLDLEMGRGSESAYFGEKLKRQVELGTVPVEKIDDMVRRILRLFWRTGVFEPEKRPKGEINTRRNRDDARRLAEAGMVLLKNDKNLLPLDRSKLKSVAVIGPNADQTHLMGPLESCGGSGAVHPDYEITPLAGLLEYLAGSGVAVRYAPGVEFDNYAALPPELLSTADGAPGLEADFYATPEELNDPAAKPILSRLDAAMELSWGHVAAAGKDASGELDDRLFAARWQGKLTPALSGRARLMVSRARLLVRVWIDGVEVISDRPVEDRLVQGSYEFDAVAGKSHDLRIEAVRNYGGFAELKLLWKQNEEGKFQAALDAARDADLVLFFGGTNHRYDREAIGWGYLPDADIPDLELPGPQAELIARIAEVNPRLVVSLVNGSVVNVEPWIDRVPALLECWYPGMEAGRAIARVLFGDAEPGGRLNCTWAKTLMDYPCHANGSYPGETSDFNAHTNYIEGIFIGYRHFDRAGIEPRFPFGYGLSYTSFDCKLRKVKVDGYDVTAVVEVTNTGSRTGSEVVQLYVRDLESRVERPFQELEGFAKLTLAPGETGRVELTLGWRDFAYYYPPAGTFLVEPGDFELRFGTSSRAIFATETITLK